MPTHSDAVRQLATARQQRTTEATIQSWVHQVLAHPELRLGRVTLEYPLPGGRRIDLLAGRLVVKTKRDLRPAGALDNAAAQVGIYLHFMHAATGHPHVGVVTDGAQWYAYVMRGHTLRRAGRHTVRPGTAEHEARRLLDWLRTMHALACPPQPRPAPPRPQPTAGPSALDNVLNALLIALLVALVFTVAGLCAGWALTTLQ